MIYYSEIDVNYKYQCVLFDAFTLTPWVKLSFKQVCKAFAGIKVYCVLSNLSKSDQLLAKEFFGDALLYLEENVIFTR